MGSTPSSTAGSSPRVRGKRVARLELATVDRLIPACAGKTAGLTRGGSRTRAHPRVCGENPPVSRWLRGTLGSSPRVRGKRVDGSRTLLRPGLIPACAGKTRGGHYPPRRGAAHPRVCGENYRSRAGGVKEYGSSPRVRGKRRARRRAARTGGLIPACAGKTTRGCSRRHQRRAHPRACGENAEVRADAWGAGGSSPRVRGKQGRRGWPRLRGRLIPACAGKTGSARAPQGSAAAHPRVCGENRLIENLVTLQRGSSPRVRGKHYMHLGENDGIRLIPACAGKTHKRGRYRSADQAHPRVCGENASLDVDALAAAWLIPACAGKTRRRPLRLRDHHGSSPRVRGKRYRRDRPERHDRLIPACAGKTVLPEWVRGWGRAHPRVCGENHAVGVDREPPGGSSPRVRGKLGGDQGAGVLRVAHPRVCGENRGSVTTCRPSAGSSPRVRGKPVYEVTEPGAFGLIPACAGKTSTSPWS